MPLLHKVVYKLSSRGWRGTRFLWRLVKLLKKVPTGLVRLPTGFVLTSNEKDFTSKAIYEGFYENGINKMLNLLGTRHRFVDVGANIGLLSFSATKKTKQSPIAFEPIKRNSDQLKLNFGAMGRDIEVHEIAIAECEGTAAIYGSDNLAHSGSASLIHSALSKFGSRNVRTTTLDNILNEFDDNGFFLKIDCEGAELKVLEGAFKLISSGRVKAALIEFSPRSELNSYFKFLLRKIPPPVEAYIVRESIRIFKRVTILKLIDPEGLNSLESLENIIFVSGEDLYCLKRLLKKTKDFDTFLLNSAKGCGQCKS